MNKNILTIDVGSDKTFSIIGSIEEDKLRIDGYGSIKTQGIRNGIITNIKSASHSIKKSVENAQRLAGININLATVSISSIYTTNMTSVGVINVPSNIISINEINRVMQIALYNANISNDYEVIHVLPFRFKVGDQDYIENPYGMTGTRLEVDTNIILISKGNLKNFKKSFEDVNISIDRIVVSNYSSAISIMREDEKEHGAIIINLGSGTSNISICIGNAIKYHYSIKAGSHNITNDISLMLNTPLNIAEYIKKKRSDLTIDYRNETEENCFIKIPIIGDEENLQNVNMETVQEIIYERISEIINILIDKVFKDMKHLIVEMKPGIILTGGMTYINGIKDIVKVTLPRNFPIRIGFANKNFSQISKDFNHKEFTTALGLLYYENGKHTEYELDSNKILYNSKERYVDDYNMQKYNMENKPNILVSKPNFQNREDSLDDLNNINNDDPKGFWTFISKIF